MKTFGILALAALLSACHMMRAEPSATPPASLSQPSGAGVFDNHEQVWQAGESHAVGVPHVVVSIEPAREAEWSVWHVRLDATKPIEASWAFRLVVQGDGSSVLTPYRAVVSSPASAASFDARQWTPLDACALRAPRPGTALSADVAACTAIAPGIGAEAALLPLAIDRDGEWLHARLYADQARGAEAREDLRLVRWFAGWAAINGGGAKADAANRDWHMDRDVRIGSEGGRYALHWRDGAPSGYSLVLERLTYREGNVPVLKLAIVDDADSGTLAYAWANPEATRIGINLGWVQVGLSREDQPAGVAGAPK
ncbi:MAG TPA: hypothetical protein VHE32_05635 [Rhodanobacteraceae bacterium]|nr:hypothetical protein [Rhodanobacteraceae bacterium]